MTPLLDTNSDLARSNKPSLREEPAVENDEVVALNYSTDHCGLIMTLIVVKNEQ